MNPAQSQQQRFCQHFVNIVIMPLLQTLDTSWHDGQYNKYKSTIPWIKKSDDEGFNIRLGCFDGAEYAS